MPQKTVSVEGIGDILLVKRRGAKNVRLSVTAAGKVRVSMPSWAPYAAGIRFARSRTVWIEKQLAGHVRRPLMQGDRVGKSHRLCFVSAAGSSINTRVTATEIIIKSAMPAEDAVVQEKAVKAAERALVRQSKILLEERLSVLATRTGYGYKNVKIKKMVSRWGSCSSRKEISLSCYLIQLPWHLIDYVLLHELVHTRYMNHSNQFWDELAKISPDIKNLRREIKKYKPGLQII